MSRLAAARSHVHSLLPYLVQLTAYNLQADICILPYILCLPEALSFSASSFEVFSLTHLLDQVEIAQLLRCMILGPMTSSWTGAV